MAIASLLMLVSGGEPITTIVRMQKKTRLLAFPSFYVHTSVASKCRKPDHLCLMWPNSWVSSLKAGQLWIFERGTIYLKNLLNLFLRRISTVNDFLSSVLYRRLSTFCWRDLGEAGPLHLISWLGGVGCTFVPCRAPHKLG